MVLWQQATISFRQLQPGLMLHCRRQPLALRTVLLIWGVELFLDGGKCFFVASGNLLPAAAAGADAALQETAARFEE